MIKNLRLFSRYFALLILITLGLSISANHARAADIPEPTELFYVADFAGVLEKNTVNHIVSQNDALFENTGAQIVVVTVDFIGNDDIENYAYKLFNQWGIGSAEKNNGVLLLLVTGADDYWALQGKGLEKVLSSTALGTLLNDYLEDDFAEGNYDSGVRKFFDAVYSRLEGIYGTVSLPNDYKYPTGGHKTDADIGQNTYDSGESRGSLLPLIIIAIIIIVVVNSGRRLGGGYYRPRRRFLFFPVFPIFRTRRPPTGSYRSYRPPTYRSGGGGSSWSSGSSRSGGSFRSSGGSRSGGGGSSRSGGGGSSRGGGSGRSR